MDVANISFFDIQMLSVGRRYREAIVISLNPRNLEDQPFPRSRCGEQGAGTKILNIVRYYIARSLRTHMAYTRASGTGLDYIDCYHLPGRFKKSLERYRLEVYATGCLRGKKIRSI